MYGECYQEYVKHYQGGGIFEHIIVDDGSSDNTAAIVKRYAQNYPHIKFIQFPDNRGVNAARNAAISIAMGEWCIILDSDDYFVDNALAIIMETMNAKPEYRHYMFAPDDMQSYFQTNEVIKGAKEKVLLYPDFLNGYIEGDFIHVCNTAIMRKHPFNETIRIYEGIFFLMFYREVGRVLFTNQIVTIRECQRQDSVTRTVIRTNKEIIRNDAKSKELMLKYFETDLVQLGMSRRLHSLEFALFEDYVLLGDYSKIKTLEIYGLSGFREILVNFFYLSHMGCCYRLLLQLYLLLKYKLFKKKLKV